MELSAPLHRESSAPESWRTPVSANPALLRLASARRVLMLQGPVGPFFDRIARWLLARGTQVRRVAFQAGDLHDSKVVHPVVFAGTPADWHPTLASLLDSWRPDCIVLFGQSRAYHKVAREHARALDIAVVVLEEGYFRPGFVTVELGGVNGYSTTLDRYVWQPEAGTVGIAPDIAPWHFQWMAWHASRHYIAMDAGRDAFVHYRHHRHDDPGSYARFWMRSWARKGWHRGTDRKLQRWLVDSEQPYFFVPLQVDGDSQITQHSTFPSNVDFIIRVLRSFSREAPRDTLLVFRQHPHARGGAGHVTLIQSLARALGVAHRVHHMIEGDTPVLAQFSRGVVLINSTVGLQALERGAPLMVMGEAPYKRPDLTFAGELDAFWQKPERPDPANTAAFLAQVKNLTQAPASVYAPATSPLAWTALVK